MLWAGQVAVITHHALGPDQQRWYVQSPGACFGNGVICADSEGGVSARLDVRIYKTLPWVAGMGIITCNYHSVFAFRAQITWTVSLFAVKLKAANSQ